MTVNYTTNLALGQPVTGTESGTWGDDVNNSVTSYLDIAIAGGLSVTITTADVTLVLTQGTSSATNIGSTTAQYAILNVSGAMTAARNLILPSSSRQYVINNNTTGGFALTVKGSATSGVTMVNGEKAHVFWNGSDYAKLSNAPGGTGSFTDLAVSGNLTFTGTGNRITGDFSNATASNRVIFQTSTASANTRIGIMPNAASTGTAGPVLYSTNDPNNASVFDIRITDGVGASLQSTFNGTGSNLPMTFHTGGSERMRLDTSGNVGIGTSSPSTSGKLTVNGNVVFGGPSGRNTATSNYIGVWTTGDPVDDARANIGFTTVAGAASSSSYITFSTNSYGVSGGERMRIDSSGNVGIGFASGLGTYGQLEVGGNANPTMALRSSTASGTVFAMTAVGATEARINAITSVPMTFFTNNLERMRLDSSGNVGIGTSSPSTYVSGGGLALQGTYGTSSAAFSIYNNSGASASNIAKIDFKFNNTFSTNSPSAAIWALNPNAAGNNGGALVLATSANGTDTTPTERMRIDSSGNVGIGTSSPSTYSSVYKTVNAIKINDQVTTIGSYYQAGVAQYGFINVSDAVGTTATSLVFSSGSNVERMRIDSSGNVGIGTSSSAARLGVVNDQAALSYLFDTSNVTNGGSSLWRMITRDIANTGTTSVDFYKPSGTGFSIINNDPNASNFTAFNVGSAERMRIDSSGNVLVTNPAGLGYGTGSGGTVTQATSKSTSVTLNKPTGQITMNAAALAANTNVSFTLNNSLLTATDTILIHRGSGGSAGVYFCTADGVGAGSCSITVRNTSAGSLSEAIVLNFTIIKGATA